MSGHRTCCCGPPEPPEPYCCVGGLLGVITGRVNNVDTVGDLPDVNFGLYPELRQTYTVNMRYRLLDSSGGVSDEITREGSLSIHLRKTAGGSPLATPCNMNELVSSSGAIHHSNTTSGIGTVTAVETINTDAQQGGTVSFIPGNGGTRVQAPTSFDGDSFAFVPIEWSWGNGTDFVTSTGDWPLTALTTPADPIFSYAKNLSVNGFFGANGGSVLLSPFSTFAARLPLGDAIGSGSMIQDQLTATYSANRTTAIAIVSARSVYNLPNSRVEFEYFVSLVTQAFADESGECITEPPGAGLHLATACDGIGDPFYVTIESTCPDGGTVGGRTIRQPETLQCYSVGTQVFGYDILDGSILVRDIGAWGCVPTDCDDPNCFEGECCEAILEGSHLKIVDSVNYGALPVQSIGSAPVLHERYLLVLDAAKTGDSVARLNAYIWFEYSAAVDPFSNNCDTDTIQILSDTAVFTGRNFQGTPFNQSFVLRESALHRSLSGRMLPPLLNVLASNEPATDPSPPTAIPVSYSLGISWGGTRNGWTLAAVQPTGLLPRARQSSADEWGAYTFTDLNARGPLTPWLVNSNIRLNVGVAGVSGEISDQFALATNAGAGRSGAVEAWCRYSASGVQSTAEMALETNLTTPGGTERCSIWLYHESRLERRGACVPQPGAIVTRVPLVAGPSPERLSSLARFLRRTL